MSEALPDRGPAGGAAPIRIVPLFDAAGNGPTVQSVASADPQLVYGGGPLLTAVEVFTLFWGAWWESGQGLQLAQRLNEFFDYVLTSPLIDQLAEYDTPTAAIGHGSRVGTLTSIATEPPASLPDATIQAELQRLISAGTLPAAQANTLYFVYLPENVTVVQGGSSSCQAFCGYHDDIDGSIFYAVEPYADCSGCLGGLTVLDALTTTSSHELCEAITDPIPGSGWYDQANGEIGDICAWKTKKLGGYTVQLEWSNAAGACVWEGRGWPSRTS
jgi:hypothetical protein